ncbi:uncharacterized protein PAC_18973 [Phialocephala subalpina]|uniref:Uncharacterized protein n=1 Tax=Phialocephala subalpina TaxID=576137 RepID=A0A1L7XVJ4_9HELO|nr:uncharacterized protein PAC_18973 [Phialocephala subalpina]
MFLSLPPPSLLIASIFLLSMPDLVPAPKIKLSDMPLLATFFPEENYFGFSFPITGLYDYCYNYHGHVESIMLGQITQYCDLYSVLDCGEDEDRFVSDDIPYIPISGSTPRLMDDEITGVGFGNDLREREEGVSGKEIGDEEGRLKALELGKKEGGGSRRRRAIRRELEEEGSSGTLTQTHGIQHFGREVNLSQPALRLMAMTTYAVYVQPSFRLGGFQLGLVTSSDRSQSCTNGCTNLRFVKSLATRQLLLQLQNHGIHHEKDFDQGSGRVRIGGNAMVDTRATLNERFPILICKLDLSCSSFLFRDLIPYRRREDDIAEVLGTALEHVEILH